MVAGLRPRTLLVSRRPLVRVWLLALTALLVVGCSSPPVVLTGTVKDAYTGEPVRSASIMIGESTITTDAEGTFTTTQWSDKDTLAVSAPDYEPLSMALAGQPALAESDALTVTLDTLLRPNTLSGTVKDAYSDQPLAGAQLAITVGVSNTVSATSDAQGRYQIAGLPEQFTLRISAPDYEPATVDLDRKTSFDLALRPNVLSGVITDRYSSKPVSGARVTVGDASATSATDGRYRVEEVAAGVTSVEISAPGYATLSQELDRSTTLDAILRPDTLVGTLRDASTSDPIANATIIATSTLSGTAVAFTRIDGSADGSFTLAGLPESGYLQVLAPGYKKSVLEISPGKLPNEIKMEPFYAKALYITAAVASVPKAVQEYVDLIEKTELNTLIVDLKSDLRDDLGKVYYDSQVPLVKELGLSADYVDMRGLVQSLKAKGIYTIARVQLFSHDNALSDARPEWSIRLKATGEVYADYPGPGIRYAYIDPTNRNVWDYNIQLGIEAAQMGFDEVNFDYVRFPDWYGDKASFTEKLLFSVPIDPVNDPETMFNTIAEFAETAHKAINSAGAYVSLDVFGRVVLGKSLTIAQDPQLLAQRTDYLCPMPYPSLWWGGIFGVDVPVKYPYEVIKGAVDAGVEEMGASYARMRPWLQDHTDPWSPVVVTYGPAEVRAQIDAAQENKALAGWLLYDSANAYKGAFNGAARPEE